MEVVEMESEKLLNYWFGALESDESIRDNLRA